MPTPALWPQPPESRASAYPAGRANTSVIATTATPTMAVFSSQVGYSVCLNRNVTCWNVM